MLKIKDASVRKINMSERALLFFFMRTDTER